MVVVSDSDVIIHLSKLQKLFLLKDLYREIAVPEYIRDEVLRRENPAITEAFENFIMVFSVATDKAKAIEKKHKIHFGEANVKALGEALRSRFLLTNERKVREAAKEEGFQVAGTIGVIFKAFRKGLLTQTEAETLLDNMRSAEFRIHPRIMDTALEIIKKEGRG